MAHTLFIIFVCSCVFSLFTTTSATVGATCTTANNVCTSDKNSECHDNSKCACKTGYTENGNKLCAKATVGTVCVIGGSDTCSAEDPNSECASTTKCACKDGYEAKTNAICLKVPGNSATKTVMTASTLVMLISTIMLAKLLF